MGEADNVNAAVPDKVPRKVTKEQKWEFFQGRDFFSSFFSWSKACFPLFFLNLTIFLVESVLGGEIP